MRGGMSRGVDSVVTISVFLVVAAYLALSTWIQDSAPWARGAGLVLLVVELGAAFRKWRYIRAVRRSSSEPSSHRND